MGETEKDCEDTVYLTVMSVLKNGYARHETATIISVFVNDLILKERARYRNE